MRSRDLSALAAALALAVACGGGGAAPAQDLRGLTRVSGPSTFAAGCTGSPGVAARNAEVEPSLAIDPRDAAHLLGAWQQDRFPDDGASGVVAAVSRDGGRTWTRSTAPFTRCTGGSAASGGDYERASDPWVTFAADGTAYQAALAFDEAGTAKAVLVSRSPDGGLTWDPPATIARDASADVGLDKETITADPLDARRVYAVWDRLTGLSSRDPAAQAGPAWFSRTVDGGRTWEPARAIHDPGPDAQTIANQIVVLPDGTLLDLLVIIAQASAAAPVQTVAVLRSPDAGLTWSAPVAVAALQVRGVVDPKTGQAVRSGTVVPAIAVDRDSGAAYVAWEDARLAGGARDGIALSRSVDGGLTWSAPVQVNRAPGAQAFTPAIAVSAAGEVGVTYYDLSEDDAGDREHTYASAWLATSRDGGATWASAPVAHRFDLRNAPLSDGLFLGDYQGLVHDGQRFVPLLVVTNTGDTANRTDVFAAALVASAPAALSLR